MLFDKHGLSAWISDLNGDELPEYEIQEISDDTIQCWIPSTNGTNFKIQWEITKNPHPKHDLCTTPYLDGTRMTGTVWNKHTSTGEHYRQSTGNSTARLFEFGQRVLTDDDKYSKPDKSSLKNLNTIKLTFEWGRQGKTNPRTTFYTPDEPAPIHEKAAKKGHSGAAKLGKTIVSSSTSEPNSVEFKYSKTVKPITFVFCYAPEDWLLAREIIPQSPEPDSHGNQGAVKRERSVTPEIVDIDELETDDEIQIIKHMIPAPVAGNKRQRTSGAEAVVRPKDEED
ncbi:hypothetical protein RSOLAG1IB_03047 [Rhizoctonia solani AG-1 IB]|uniref:DUF7918 domain-containing protein n=1 Tax=Thanatephorus cucumeris (strain AG1-IB / isolate 7/3/14) TaxID=1108050 RepID=A0A0B7FJY2_THACB|nr:hypothetical protein RSOLAG1IB_03047 [Rhizoctonia solani AG-1 IB]